MNLKSYKIKEKDLSQVIHWDDEEGNVTVMQRNKVPQKIQDAYKALGLSLVKLLGKEDLDSLQ